MNARCREYEVTCLPEPLDAETVANLRSRFSDLARDGRLCHIVDLRGADPHRSETIAAMIVILRSLRERGGDVRIVAPTRELRHMFDLTGLDKVFCVFDSLDRALSETECPGRPAPCKRRRRWDQSALRLLRRSIGLASLLS